jgi:tRNA(fMet)-specific endonuclease VapC
MAEEEVCTTPITACELYAGAFKSRTKETEAKKVKDLLLRMEILDFSVHACERFGKIRSQLEAAGTPIGDLDIMIGSIALAHNQGVLTRDVEHFEKIPGLIVDTW